MTDTIHDRLLALHRAGGLGHLTLARTRDKGYMASHRSPGSSGWVCEHDPDPGEAILRALAGNTEEDGTDLI